MSSSQATHFTLEIPPVPQGIDAVASLAGGFWMVALAASSRMRARLPVLAVGGWLLARGAMGVLEELNRLEVDLASKRKRVTHPDPSIPVPEDPLDEASWESFPASDPPASGRRETRNGVH